MGWHLLETLLQQVGEHSTLIGKLWVTATFVFRFIIVASVGDAVYSDEQSDFTCNTAQPGCENICFNLFSPISHLRFWAAQIIAVCTPSIVFIVYAAHMLLKVPEQESEEDLDDEAGLAGLEEDILPPETSTATRSPRKRGKAPGRMPSNRSRRSGRPMRPRTAIGMVRGFANPPGEATDIIEDIKEVCEDERIDEDGSDATMGVDDQNKSLSDIDRELAMLDNMDDKDKEKRIKKQIQFVYVISLLLRTGFEAVFLWLQYVLYGFKVPELFECERFPCPKIVDCFVSRPKEKTLFLWFMFVVSCLCLLLNIIEIKYLGIKKLVKVLCHNGNTEDTETDDEVFMDSKEDNVSPSNGSKGSKRSYFKMDKNIIPSAPGGDAIYNVVDDGKEDSIGFDAIGSLPSYPMPGYPIVHRYGMLLNATPPPPLPPTEPERYYL